ncbi:MAG: multiheme c-type cytochrome, partial [Planctomycetota bacterium]
AVVLGLAAFIATRLSAEAPVTPPETPIADLPAIDPLDAWERPAVALLFTGEANGYLEPCGCSETQNGGVARRSTLLKELRDERGWEVVAADAGGTIRRTRLQAELKFAAMRQALDRMGYGVLNLGAEELRLGMDYLVQHIYDAPPMLGANTALFGDTTGQTALETGIARVTYFEAGGMKIGVTGVVGRSTAGGLADPDANSLIGIGEPEDVLPPALAEMDEAGCDVRVLLSQANPDETERFLTQFPGFHMAVTAGGPEDPVGEPTVVPTDAGDAMLLRVGHKGKNAGLIGVYPNEQGEPQFTYALLTLSKAAYAHDGEMDAVMASYQQSIADNLESIFADLPPASPPRPGGYVGAAKCGECHKKAYAKWLESPHSHAYESLSKGRDSFEGTWVDRKLDPECLSCHVTGWDPQGFFPYEGGYLPERLAAGSPGGGIDGTQGVSGMERYTLLQAQGCENCHGPGSAHTATFEQWQADPNSVTPDELLAANASMRIELATAAQAVCVKCHDGDNSPEFDFDTYWPKIAHPWRD